MKLISVKILGEDFRSLSANKLYKFNLPEKSNRLSTKVFAGLNASGKSNLLELFSEIFYYLDIFHLSTVSKEEKRGKGFGFEIEYLLPFSSIETTEENNRKWANDNWHIRIRKPIDEIPEFAMKRQSENDFTRIEEGTEKLLPTKVIAYTSGQNELISNPYYKVKYHYFKEIEKNKRPKETNIADYDRLFFLDYTANFSIFISNYLLSSDAKLKYIKNIFSIEDLHSFRITINFVNYKKNPIPLNESMQLSIERLKLCATSWIERKFKKEHILILDYSVNSATKQAFKYHFDSAFGLFKCFYELDILNLHLVPTDTRGLILKAHKSLNLSDEMPKADPSRLAFRIEKIVVRKATEASSGSLKHIYYKQLSDGEHQFNEVIGSVLMMEEEGCLFLMDEPDTHFNPMWRAKLIKLLNYVAATDYDENGNPTEVRNQEIILTTHSPFVISDSQTKDVYKFERTDGVVNFYNPKIETYGASVGLLLEVIFDRDISISDLSNADLDDMRQSIKTLDDIEEVKEKLLDFGESVEKFDVYSFLRLKEEEFKNKE